MKKSITLGLAAMLATSCITPVAFAQDASSNVSKNVIAKSNSKASVSFIEKVQVKELTLEDAIKYAQEKNYQSIQLDLEYEKIKKNESLAQDQRANLNNLIATMRATRNQLQEELKKLEELQKNPPADNNEGNEEENSSVDPTVNLQEQMAKIREQINQLNTSISSQEKAILQIDESLNTLDVSGKNLLVNKDKLRESTEFTVTSIFVGLIQLEDQIEFLEKTLDTQKNEIDAIRKKYELGLVSKKDYEKATREEDKIQSQISQLNKQLQTEKQNFANTIGITYSGDYKLVRPNIDNPALVTLNKSVDDLVKDSYDMKSLQNTLENAEKSLEDKRYSDYTAEEVEIAELDVEITELKIKSLAIQLEKSINSTMTQLKQQYDKVKQLEKELNDSLDDNDDLKIYYELGLISKHDFDKAGMNKTQAQFNYDNAKYQYFLLTKQVLLMKNGFIITN